MKDHDRRMLKKIDEQGHCNGISCNIDRCPLSYKVGDSYCVNHDYDPAKIAQHARELLAADNQIVLTREDIEEICKETCYEIIADYLPILNENASKKAVKIGRPKTMTKFIPGKFYQAGPIVVVCQEGESVLFFPGIVIEDKSLRLEPGHFSDTWNPIAFREVELTPDGWIKV